MSYSTDEDVRNLLGQIRDRLPTWVTVANYREIAAAEVVDRLAAVYPDGIPGFAGTGLEVVRYAEAKLAAAELLEAIRVNLPDLGDAPDRLRESANRALSDGVPGYPIGSVDVDDDGDPETPPALSTPTPRVSSFTSLSAFPDPYGPARLDPLVDEEYAGRPIRFQ